MSAGQQSCSLLAGLAWASHFPRSRRWNLTFIAIDIQKQFRGQHSAVGTFACTAKVQFLAT